MTTELTGHALDWAVDFALSGKALEVKQHKSGSGEWMFFFNGCPFPQGPRKFSTDWSQGMPILDRAGICVRAIRKPGHALDGTYMAMEARRLGTSTSPQWAKVCWPEAKPGSNNPPRIRWDGPSHLIAGLRCFVGITLGDEVDVPDELV